jgi:hypothetical protein
MPDDGVIVGISLRGDLRKACFPSQSRVTLKRIESFIGAEFGLKSFTAEYLSHSGDFCVLTEEVLPNALDAESAAGRTLRLEITAEADMAMECQPCNSGANSMSLELASLQKDGGIEPRRFATFIAITKYAQSLKPDEGPTLMMQWWPRIARWCAYQAYVMKNISPQEVRTAVPAIKALADTVRIEDNLREFASYLDAVVATDPTDIDASALSVHILETLKSVPAETQRRVVMAFASALLPFMDGCMRVFGYAGEWEERLSGLVNHGVTCKGCGMSPIQGPRFWCCACEDYNLCGSCSLRRDELHPKAHDPYFKPLLFPPECQARARDLVHHDIACNGCSMSPIKGPRFWCRACGDYNLCEACSMKRTLIHPADHDRHFSTLLCPPSLERERMYPPLLDGFARSIGGKGMGKGGGKGKGKGKNKGAPFIAKQVRFDILEDTPATGGFAIPAEVDVAAYPADDHSVGNDVWACLRAADFVGEHEPVRLERSLGWQDAVIPACRSADWETTQKNVLSQETTDAFMAADFVGNHDGVDELQSQVDWAKCDASAIDDILDILDDIEYEFRTADFVGEHHSVMWEPMLPRFEESTEQIPSPRSHMDEEFMFADWTGSPEVGW